MLMPSATTPTTMTLELGNTYEYIQGQSEGRQRFVAEIGGALSGITETHEVIIDESTTEALFVIDWEGYGSCRKGCPSLELIKPDGSTYDESYDFDDIVSGHRGWRVLNPDPGTWLMMVTLQLDPNITLEPDAGMPYQVIASGQSDLTLNLILPGSFQVSTTGFSFPIFAILSDDGPIPCEGAEAIVTAPDGLKTKLQLFDDGNHGDGRAMDGLCGNIYTRANQAETVTPPDEGVPTPPTPEDEGGYQVELNIVNTQFQRQALGAFAILEGADTDLDGMPDAWEDDHGLDKNDPDDADLDPDLDFLTNAEEYLAGTDPHNSDTDGGGENDGSEIDYGSDPLDPSDDEIEAPDFFHAAPDNGKVQLTYDVKVGYAGLELWKAPAPEGPWNLEVGELPSNGAYQDAASNGETYYYRLIAGDGATTLAPTVSGHRSAVLESESVTPSVDPWPPQAFVIINSGAPSTKNKNVLLSFGPYELEPSDPNTFNDITEMMISNDPSFTGAAWQSFVQENVPWTLVGTPNELNFVYVRFRDVHDNETVGTETGVILYDPNLILLPLIAKP
jgi:hypothetical protein